MRTSVSDAGALLAASLTLAACTHQQPLMHAAPLPEVRATLIDSVPWKSDDDEGYLRRIQVHVGSTVDTIPSVLTAEAPIVVGARVLGFAYREDEIASAFEYDAVHRALTRDSLPPDFNGYFSAPSIAPDGRHIAYVVVPGNDTAWAVVSAWPSGARVWRSAAVEIPATDARGGTLTRWLSPDTAEVFIQSGEETGSHWFHVVFSVRENRGVRTDSVDRVP